jgi:hypothetical protein
VSEEQLTGLVAYVKSLSAPPGAAGPKVQESKVQ